LSQITSRLPSQKYFFLWEHLQIDAIREELAVRHSSELKTSRRNLRSLFKVAVSAHRLFGGDGYILLRSGLLIDGSLVVDLNDLGLTVMWNRSDWERVKLKHFAHVSNLYSTISADMNSAGIVIKEDDQL
jgi:hypothetical protein